MEIELNLNHHCIETGAKKKYEQLIKHYFSQRCSSAHKLLIERQIEALRFFLEHADFPTLRNLYPKLDGTHKLYVVLKISNNIRDIWIIINDKIVQPEWKDKKLKDNGM